MSSGNTVAVLVVDDDADILGLLKKQLSVLPHTVIATASPAEAIHYLKTRDIGVLLCDLHLDGVDGNEVMRIARGLNPEIVSIVITGQASLESTVRAINEGGVWKYIEKPWEHIDVISVVEEAALKYSRRKTLIDTSTEAKKGLKQTKIAVVNMAASPQRRGSQVRIIRRHPKRRIARKVLLFGQKADLSNSRYKFGEVLGEGGNGTVYRAQDLLLGMPVAIKVLSKEVATDKEAITVLKEEARIAMQLSHAHIVRLHDLQKVGENYFIVMEYVEGRTLRQLLEQHGALALGFVVKVVQVCAEALGYAHHQGVLHQDLKPENLMLTGDGVIKIIDFGTACLMDTQRLLGPIVGTPEYMSPEQKSGEVLDVRTDVFSLGIIAYELLTNDVPYPEDGDPMVNEALADISRDVLAIISRAIAIDRQDRWRTAMEFAEALGRAVAEEVAPESMAAVP